MWKLFLYIPSEMQALLLFLSDFQAKNYRMELYASFCNEYVFIQMSFCCEDVSISNVLLCLARKH